MRDSVYCRTWGALRRRWKRRCPMHYLDQGDGKVAPAPRLLYLTRDLFFGVRIADTAARAGWQAVSLQVDDDPDLVIGQVVPVLVLADLQADAARWGALLRAAQSARNGPITAVAFGSHRDLATRAAAQQAGASAVIANSRLFSDLPGFLARYAPAAADPG